MWPVPNCGPEEKKLDCRNFYETREPSTSPPLDISPFSTLSVRRDPVALAPNVGRPNTNIVAGVWHLARHECEKSRHSTITSVRPVGSRFTTENKSVGSQRVGRCGNEPAGRLARHDICNF